MASGREKERRKERARLERARRAEGEFRHPRGCWCGPGDAHCSTCEVCGRPGHLRHFPGSAPVTGSWCTLHYWRLKVLSPSGSVGFWLWLAVALFLVAALVGLLGG